VYVFACKKLSLTFYSTVSLYVSVSVNNSMCVCMHIVVSECGACAAPLRAYLLRDLPTFLRQARPPQPLRAAIAFFCFCFWLVVPKMLESWLIPEPLH
jgi:hypothetical protein